MSEEQEKRSKKHQDNVNIIIYSVFTILAGIVGILVLNCCDSKFDQHLYVNYINPVAGSLFSAFIVLGMGTLFFELYGYLSYFRKRIAEVFTDKEMVDILDIDYKKNLKHRLMESIYAPNTKDSNEILDLFNEKLSNLLDAYYYSYYNIYVHCSQHVEKKKRYIKKTIEKEVEYKEVNSNRHNCIENILEVSCKQICDPGIKVFELESIYVNGKLLTEGEYEIVPISGAGKTYSLIYRCMLKERKAIEDSLKIKIKYKTVVPHEDKHYSIKIDHLCKKMICQFSFDNAKYEVMGIGFNFSVDSRKSFDIISRDTLCEAKSKDWVLPGEGVSFSIFNK